MPAFRRPLCAALMLIVLSAATASARTDEPVAEVYRNSAMTINAGVAGLAGRIVHFGDVLSLEIVVSYDSSKLLFEEPGDDFFKKAWPEDSGPVLVDRRISHAAGPGPNIQELRAVFRFQIFDCPDEPPTCPGNREYPLPEFTLQYRLAGDTATDDDAAQSVSIRPWPATLTVSSVIPLDKDNELYAFGKYFPTGGYPEPRSGVNRATLALWVVGVGVAILLGDLLMGPFNFKKRRQAKSPPRWQAVLLEARDDDGADESHLFDRLRRGVVWYCTDELKLDPFDWLETTESGNGGEAPEDSADLRSLFIELLHDPAGRGPELRTRLSELIVHDA